MELKQTLLNRAHAYCEQHKMKLSTLSFRLANDGKFFARLMDGKDLTVGKYESVTRKLKILEEKEIDGEAA